MDYRKELLEQLRKYLAGGQTIKQFREWIKKNEAAIIAVKNDDLLKLFNHVAFGLDDLDSGHVVEKGLRKTWQRMLNALIMAEGKRPAV